MTPKRSFIFRLGSEAEQNVSLQNIPLWHKDYFELINLRISRCKRSSENSSRSYPFVRKIYIYKRNLICKEGNLINGKDADLNR